MSEKKLLNAIISIQNWGNSTDLEKLMKYNSNIASVFHTMGSSSYILDTGFRLKSELEAWLKLFKGLTLSSGVPAVLKIRTQKVIEVLKSKEQNKLQEYLKTAEKQHFFMYIDTYVDSTGFINYMNSVNCVYSLLHLQGEHSYVAEVIPNDYSDYKDLLQNLKKLDGILRIDTHEVISVLKYRGEIVDDKGNLLFPEEDTREMFTF